MGQVAAKSVADLIQSVLQTNDYVRMVFAAAPSQNEMLHALCKIENVDWSKVIAFHMDEYLGLRRDSPQLFGNYLRQNIFGKVQFKEVNYLNPNSKDTVAECKRYGALISKAPIDIVCMGIGENGHIAFNDPPVADFNDPAIVKVVELDAACRQQQVNDGCFQKISDVPTQALTLTIPTLMSAKWLSIVVPGKLKSDAIHNSLLGQKTTTCPASILRTHKGATLYLDPESASRLKNL